MPPLATPVIVFDGDCVFCQRSVRFIHRHDRGLVFRFAARQSPIGQRLLADAGVHAAPNSMVLIDGSGASLRSDAVLRIAARLDAPWSLARVFLVVPRVLRDAVYRIVAAVRHRVSRHLPACERPDASLRGRLLE